MQLSSMKGAEHLLILSLLAAPLMAFTSVLSQFPTSTNSGSTRLFSVSKQNPITIALTREEGNNGKLRKELMARIGDSTITLEELPCIAHADGEDLDRLEATLLDGAFDYIAVTSPEAARVLATAWTKNRDILQARKAPSVAVVGTATQAALEKYGIPVDFCPSKATANTLVEELPVLRDGTTLLYPASAKAATTLQDGLQSRGFVVTRLNTYDTTIATWTEEQKELANRMTVACFGSPSAVEAWLQNSNQNRNVLAACIGETSATACREFLFPESKIFFPEKPGIPGWAQAVEEALQSLSVAHT